MTWVEVSGKTLDEAKTAAAEQLGVPTDQLLVEVLEEEAKGFLGFGQPKVVIRASILDSAESDVQDIGMPEQITESASEYSSKGAQAVGFLQRILEAMHFDAQPNLVSETDEEIQIDITGESDDIGRLIGRHGQTLDAIQYLVGIIINRDPLRRVRILLDAEGYRERYNQMLEERVRELAKSVKESGEEAVIEPQSPRDRRVVHMALADDPDVCTYSEGEGNNRHIVISPRK